MYICNNKILQSERQYVRTRGPASKGGAFLCKLCKKRWETFVELYDHIRADHPVKEFKCSECPMSHDTQNGLGQHLTKKHSLSNKFVCDFCGQRCVSKDALLKHRRVDHLQDSEPSLHDDAITCSDPLPVKPTTNVSEPNPVPSYTAPTVFWCRIQPPLCPFQTNSQEELYEHIRNDHPAKEHVCSECPIHLGCYKKLNTITESVAQLLHHKDTIVTVLVESLADDVNQHGADAILDVISHLALDLQQEIYPCLPTLFPALIVLLKLQNAQLISNVFKTFAHIFKTTWRQMLPDFESNFTLLLPLLLPPSRPHAVNFAAECLAFLIRKHGDPETMFSFLLKTLTEDAELSKSCRLTTPVARLIFETVKGVQYKFNSYAEKYLSVLLDQTEHRMFDVQEELMGFVVQKIKKDETEILWKLLLDRVRDPNINVGAILNNPIFCFSPDSVLVQNTAAALPFPNELAGGATYNRLDRLVMKLPNHASPGGNIRGDFEIYPCLPTLFPALIVLLKLQNAQLISNVFKTFAHIFKTTWRQMLPDFESNFTLLLPLLLPPSRPHAVNFAAECLAFLIRKHGDPETMFSFLLKTLTEDAELSKSCRLTTPVARLIFETIKGVQYKFNSYAEKYLSVLLDQTEHRMFDVQEELMGFVVQKIKKDETEILWKLLLDRVRDPKGEWQRDSCLRMVNVLLKGGRHTYLISPEPLCEILCTLSSTRSCIEATIAEYLPAVRSLKRYLGQEDMNHDVIVLETFLREHPVRDISIGELISTIQEEAQLGGVYSELICNSLENRGQYSSEIAEVIRYHETETGVDNVVAGRLKLFQLNRDRMAYHVKVVCHPDPPVHQKFWSLKIIQAATNEGNEKIIKSLNDSLAKISEMCSPLALEIIKTLACLGDYSHLGALFLLLNDRPKDIMLLQAIIWCLAGGSVDDKLEYSAAMEVLKGNFGEASTPIRYFSLSILSSLSPEDSGIQTALSAERTPIGLETYRDKLRLCSELRWMEDLTVEQCEFRIRYLLGSLQWSFKPLWDGLTKIVIAFTENQPKLFWEIFNEVRLGPLALRAKFEEMVARMLAYLSLSPYPCCCTLWPS
eukprot:sb/3461425/